MGVLRTPRPRARGASDRGAALVEFVAVFPVLLLVFFAIMEFGWFGYAYAETWTAAREGARQAVTVNPQGAVDRLAECSSVEDAVVGRIAIRNIDETDDAQVTILYKDAAGTTVADCQGGTAPETLGCSTAVPPVCNGDDLIGISVEVSVTQTYQGLSIPLLGNLFAGADLSSTQIRTVQSGREF